MGSCGVWGTLRGLDVGAANRTATSRPLRNDGSVMNLNEFIDAEGPVLGLPALSRAAKAEIQQRLEVLDAPPLFTPTPSSLLGGVSVGAWAKGHHMSPARAFEFASLAHARDLLPALTDLSLCPDNALSIDFETQTTRTVVGQVKSGRTARQTAIDQALGAATLPGRGAGRQHVFFYSEAGYTSGSYHLADQRGLFLWHIDFYGRVLPWSAAARWLMSRTDELRDADVEQTQNILDQCAWREAADRVNAREWVMDMVDWLWREHFGEVPEDTGAWTHFVLWAVEAAEALQGARSAVEEMFRGYLFEARMIQRNLDQDPNWPLPQFKMLTPHHFQWRDPSFTATRERLLWRLNWLGNGAGPATGPNCDWPDLPEEQMDLLFAWNTNCWDGDSQFHAARTEELKALNKARRAFTGRTLTELIDHYATSSPDRAAALQALNKGRWECPKCIHTSGHLTDVDDFGGAPHLVAPERVWAAMLRCEKEPPQMWQGFSRSPEYEHLWWGQPRPQ